MDHRNQPVAIPPQVEHYEPIDRIRILEDLSHLNKTPPS